MENNHGESDNNHSLEKPVENPGLETKETNPPPVPDQPKDYSYYSAFRLDNFDDFEKSFEYLIL
jgi:hypothetical protein